MITSLWGLKEKVSISPESPTIIIGERLNPTGRKKLAAALEERNLDLYRQEALAQQVEGAMVIDVNVGAAGIDQEILLPEAVKIVQEATGLPICVDSSDRNAIAAALRVVEGKPLVNSVTGEEASLAHILPLIKQYGAAVVGLCVDETGIPPTAEARFAVAERILQRARELGIPDNDVIIDPVVVAASTQPDAGKVTLHTAWLVSERLGLNLTMGASNISFGLPQRPLINNAFMAMALQSGVNAPITNPGQPGLVESVLAADLILARDEYGMRYIKHYRKKAQAASA
jgi:5-methyltetrahydrofolate--homocysteine methyltransferase